MKEQPGNQEYSTNQHQYLAYPHICLSFRK
jgi:hypothetical protein